MEHFRKQEKLSDDQVNKGNSRIKTSPNVEHSWVLIEDLLGPIAMVDRPVHYHYLRRSMNHESTEMIITLNEDDNIANDDVDDDNDNVVDDNVVDDNDDVDVDDGNDDVGNDNDDDTSD